MRRRGFAAMAVLAVLAALAAAAIPLVNSRSESRPRPMEKVIAIFKTQATSNAFWAAAGDGVASGAQDFGLSVSIRAPRDEIYVDEQIQIMEGAIAEKPAAIVLAAGDVHALVGPVKEAKAAGIKVVCVDSFIESDDADAKIGTDNFEAGQKCGAALLRNLSGGGRVAVMSYVQGSSTAIGREAGFREAVEGKVAVAATSYSSSEAARAYAQAKELLAQEPRLGGIAALNLPTLLGAAKALAESGRWRTVALVGVDSSAEVMKYIERGVIRDTIVQKPFNMGYLSMATVRDLLSGKKPKRSVNTGSVDIDKANMFDPENQKLLFPVAGQ
jgi:ribose transport system substrate-binding protein